MNKSNTTRELGVSKFLFFLTCAALIAAGVACRKSVPSSESGPAAASGATFEGTVAMAMNAPGAHGIDVTYYIKGGHARMETKMQGHPNPDNVMLWDLSAGKMTSMFESQKSYVVMNMDAMAGRGMPGSSPESQTFPKLTDTGKQETIAGYPCHDWVIGDKQNMEVCFAKGLGDFGLGSAGSGGLLGRLLSPKMRAEAASHPEWAKIVDGGAFPLKTTMTENGKPTFTMEATNIQRKSVDDSMFTIPPDYKEVTAPAIPGLGGPPKQ
jgi:hypothetical protein